MRLLPPAAHFSEIHEQIHERYFRDEVLLITVKPTGDTLTRKPSPVAQWSTTAYVIVVILAAKVAYVKLPLITSSRTCVCLMLPLYYKS